MFHSLTLCEFGFEESYFVYLAISCCNPKALAASASGEYSLTPHDPFVACMCDVGILESYLSSRECVYDDIGAPIGDRHI